MCVAGEAPSVINETGDIPRDYAEISSKIERSFADLSPQLRQAARYVLDRPDEVALQSMRRLATGAGVKPATMVRLAKALDYPGFEAFREPFRNRLRRPAGNYSKRARALQARGGAEERHAALLAEMAAVDQDNLRQTFDTIGAGPLSASADILADARRLHVIGLRSCYPVAFYFQYACRIFRTDVDLLDGRGGTLMDGLRGIGETDAMVAVSFAPYTRDTVQVVKYAAGRGARVVAITDSPVSPLAAVANQALIVANSSPSLFQSLVPAMAVAQALVALLMARAGKTALAAVGESETLLHDFHAYWEETVPWTARIKAGAARPEDAS